DCCLVNRAPCLSNIGAIRAKIIFRRVVGSGGEFLGKCNFLLASRRISKLLNSIQQDWCVIRHYTINSNGAAVDREAATISRQPLSIGQQKRGKSPILSHRESYPAFRH